MSRKDRAKANVKSLLNISWNLLKGLDNLGNRWYNKYIKSKEVTTMKNLIKIIATENTIDRDGWPITLEHTAWKDEAGNIYEHKLDRDGWPIEVLRTDWKEKA